MKKEIFNNTELTNVINNQLLPLLKEMGEDINIKIFAHEGVATCVRVNKGVNSTESAPQSQRNLRVEFPNGTIIEKHNASDTLVEVIAKIGPARVMELGLVHSQVPLVDSKRTDNPTYLTKQKEIPSHPGYFVFPYSATAEKAEQIRTISDRLNLGLKVTMENKPINKGAKNMNNNSKSNEMVEIHYTPSFKSFFPDPDLYVRYNPTTGDMQYRYDYPGRNYILEKESVAMPQKDQTKLSTQLNVQLIEDFFRNAVNAPDRRCGAHWVNDSISVKWGDREKEVQIGDENKLGLLMRSIGVIKSPKK